MPVDKLLGKLLLLMVVLGIGVFYGVGISKNGIEQVHGPIGDHGGGGAEVKETGSSDAKPAVQGEVIDERQTVLVQSEKLPPGSKLGFIFDKIGSLLHVIADGVIRFFVGLGEAVLS